MSIPPITILLKPALSVAAKYIPFFRRLLVERRAGQNPYVMPLSNYSLLLDQALKRLGQLDTQDPMWKKIISSLSGIVVRPEEFKKPHVVSWLSKAEVKECLGRVVSAQLVGMAENEDDLSILTNTYMVESGESEHIAKNILKTAIIFLKSSIEAAATDSGTSGIAQVGFASVHQVIENLRNDVSAISKPNILTDGIVVEHHSHDAKTA